MDKQELDSDCLADNVEKAILAGKYKDAPEKEAMLTRLAALEGLVKSYREIVSRFDDRQSNAKVYTRHAVA
jgi:hypothetical protein